MLRRTQEPRNYWDLSSSLPWNIYKIQTRPSLNDCEEHQTALMRETYSTAYYSKVCQKL